MRDTKPQSDTVNTRAQWKESQESRGKAKHSWKRQRGKDVDEQFQCLRDAVSRKAQVLPRLPGSLRGPGRNKCLHGSCLWKHSPLYALIRAFLQRRRSNSIAGSDDCMSSYISVNVPLTWSSCGSAAIRYLSLHMWNVGPCPLTLELQHDTGPPIQFHRYGLQSIAARHPSLPRRVILVSNVGVDAVAGNYSPCYCGLNL